jgi:hypothetical protein
MQVDCLGHLIISTIIFLVGLGLAIKGALKLLVITDPTINATIVDSNDMREPISAYYVSGSFIPPSYGDRYGYCKNLKVCDQPLVEKDEFSFSNGCKGTTYDIPYCNSESFCKHSYNGKHINEVWITKPEYADDIGRVENKTVEKGNFHYPAVCDRGPGLPAIRTKTNKCDVTLKYEFEGKDFETQQFFDSATQCSQSFPDNSKMEFRLDPNSHELKGVDEKTPEQNGLVLVGIGCIMMLLCIPTILKSFTKEGCEQLKRETLARMQVMGNIAEATAYGLARSGGSGGGWSRDDGIGEA